jgi:AcrR family transcriptional regulator
MVAYNMLAIPRRENLLRTMENPAKPELKDDSSREKLIRSAERLFATKGFNGVSVRDIANAAGVNSALIGYYFRGKEGLLSEVYLRHCRPLISERERLLAEFRATDAHLTLERVLEAFIRPSLTLLGNDDGASGISRLRAILAAEDSELLEQLVAENFDASSRLFVEAINGCVPHLHREEVLWRFHFLLGTIYYTAAGPNRIRILSGGKCDPSDPKATASQLIPFLATGFRAPGVKKETSRALPSKKIDQRRSSVSPRPRRTAPKH